MSVALAIRPGAGRGDAAASAVGFLHPGLLLPALLAVILVMFGAPPASAQDLREGVATCAGSTCHGRQAPDGAVVRQNELVVWRDPSSSAGAHSRAYRTLEGAWAQRIADRMGIGRASSAPACLGCHADAPALRRGGRYQISDGVSCESCHGSSEGWLASHAAGASHADNVARGMKALDDPRVLASTCLDCHLGSENANQFVSHRMMSAGHPRLTFELDLFNAFQRHHDVDADYLARKSAPGGANLWAVGQAMALERSLTLFARADRGQEGVFPEFYFFDCHSCHRPITDDPNPAVRFQSNPGRPIPWGMPPFNDENMILLTAAARTLSPAAAERFQTDSRAFHTAMAGGREGAVAAARTLAASTRNMSNLLGARGFSRGDTLAILRSVLSDAITPRYTDYSGGVQAVMAVDTLLASLVSQGAVSSDAAVAMRPDIEAAYRAVREPNSYRPDDFRQAMRRIDAALERAT